MKVEFINRLGGKMFVDESRVEEYMAAGYKLAAKTSIKVPEEKVQDKTTEKKPSFRKTIKKKD